LHRLVALVVHGLNGLGVRDASVDEPRDQCERRDTAADDCDDLH
jgi:hypothetical protein